MIGKNIYKLRIKRGLTLSELAERASTAKSYLSNIERNINKNPSIQVIEKIAGALQVDPSELLKGEKIKEVILVEEEWAQLIHEFLKKAGIKTEDVRDNIMLFEFIKWRKDNK